MPGPLEIKKREEKSRLRAENELVALEASRVTSAAVAAARAETEQAARAETERRKVESLELGSLENEFFQLLCSVSKELQRVTEERATLFAKIRIKVIYSPFVNFYPGTCEDVFR